MKYYSNVINGLKEIGKSKIHLFLIFLFAFFIFAFNALINNYKILFSNFSFKLFGSLLLGTLYSMTNFSLILLAITSVLAGIVLSMTVFLVQRQIGGTLGASSSGVLMSVVAPACPSCAIGLLSTFGMGGFLAFLPFKGIELGILGIALLSVSLVFLSGKIVTKTCEIKVR